MEAECLRGPAQATAKEGDNGVGAHAAEFLCEMQLNAYDPDYVPDPLGTPTRLARTGPRP